MMGMMGGRLIGAQVASAFESAATRASPAERSKRFSRAARALASAIELRKDSDEALLLAYVTGLATLSVHVSPAEAARLCGPPARILASRLSHPDGNRVALTVALSNLAPRLAAADARQVATTILEAFVRESDPSVRANLAQLLITMTDRVEPTGSGHLFARLSENLAHTLEKSAANVDGGSAAALLAIIAKRLDPAELRLPGNPVIPTLRGIAEKTNDPESRALLAWGLAPLAERLGREESAKICGPLAESLIHSVRAARNENARVGIIRGLAALAIRLAPEKAVEVVRLIAASVEEGKDWGRAEGDSNSLVTVFYYLFNDLDASDSTSAAKLLVAALAQEKDSTIRATLGAGLCRLAERMNPAEAGRVCGPVIDEMAAALVAKKGHIDYLCDGFITVASQVSPHDAAHVGRVLGDALNIAPDNGAEWQGIQLAFALATVAGRMQPAEAARTRRRIATVLTDAMKQMRGFVSPYLARILSSLATGMEPAEATRFFASSLDYETDANSPHHKPSRTPQMVGMGGRPSFIMGLAEALVTAAARLGAAEAATICGQTGNVLLARIATEPDFSLRNQLASSLSKVAGKMEPIAASSVCDKAIDILMRARVERSQESASIDNAVAMLLPRLDPELAGRRARDLAIVMVAERNYGIVKGEFNSILNDTSRDQISRRVARIAKTAAPGLEGMLESAARVSAEPFPCRLTTQELVDLLKMPTCVGAVRRVVLDHLGNRYGRRFVNHWAFVRFATEQKLNLDFTTPPQRPDPRTIFDQQLGVPDAPSASNRTE